MFVSLLSLYLVAAPEASPQLQSRVIEQIGQTLQRQHAERLGELEADLHAFDNLAPLPTQQYLADALFERLIAIQQQPSSRSTPLDDHGLLGPVAESLGAFQPEQTAALQEALLAEIDALISQRSVLDWWATALDLDAALGAAGLIEFRETVQLRWLNAPVPDPTESDLDWQVEQRLSHINLREAFGDSQGALDARTRLIDTLLATNNPDALPEFDFWLLPWTPQLRRQISRVWTTQDTERIQTLMGGGVSEDNVLPLTEARLAWLDGARPIPGPPDLSVLPATQMRNRGALLLLNAQDLIAHGNLEAARSRLWMLDRDHPAGWGGHAKRIQPALDAGLEELAVRSAERAAAHIPLDAPIDTFQFDPNVLAHVHVNHLAATSPTMGVGEDIRALLDANMVSPAMRLLASSSVSRQDPLAPLPVADALAASRTLRFLRTFPASEQRTELLRRMWRNVQFETPGEEYRIAASMIRDLSFRQMDLDTLHLAAVHAGPASSSVLTEDMRTLLLQAAWTASQFAVQDQFHRRESDSIEAQLAILRALDARNPAE